MNMYYYLFNNAVWCILGKKKSMEINEWKYIVQATARELSFYLAF